MERKNGKGKSKTRERELKIREGWERSIYFK